MWVPDDLGNLGIGPIRNWTDHKKRQKWPTAWVQRRWGVWSRQWWLLSVTLEGSEWSLCTCSASGCSLCQEQWFHQMGHDSFEGQTSLSPGSNIRYLAYQIFTFQYVTVENCSYEVAMKITLWLGIITAWGIAVKVLRIRKGEKHWPRAWLRCLLVLVILMSSGYWIWALV